MVHSHRERERRRESEKEAIGPRRKIKRVKNRIKATAMRPICLVTPIFVFDSWTSYWDEIMM